MFTLEVVATSLLSVRTARDAGAGRIELCSALGTGGLTPSASLITAAVRMEIPVFVLVRPREGHFCYSAEEAKILLEDIAFARRAGASGVVVGAVTRTGEVDEALVQEMVGMAGELDVTFHRAFDTIADQEKALEVICRSGCTRILTSGGAASAPQAAARIHALARQAEGRIVVMPGCGILPSTIEPLFHPAIREFHMSARRMVREGRSDLFDLAYGEVDGELVRQTMDLLGRYYGASKPSR